ncbi:hypothetical protein M0R04_10990 [Candidatus Dojkabacteria bacterium]|jgi:hypothetical protein|nr:hypothetical protein [Candidatus Dojkabacteria bacterium]
MGVVNTKSNTMYVNFDPNNQSFTPISSVVDSGNSSTDQLANGANFTGTGFDCTGYSNVGITIHSDKDSAASGIKFQFSMDNTNWDDTYSFTLDASASTTRRFQFPVCARYFRVFYTNGTTLTTEFRCQTIVHRSNILTSIHRLDDTIKQDRSTQIVKAVTAAKYNEQQSYTSVAEGEYDNLSITAWRELRTKDQRQLDLANCNDSTAFTVLGNDTTNLANTVDHVFGTGAITFDKVNGLANTVYAGVQDTITSLNVSEIFESGGFVGLGCKLTSLADVVSVFLRIGTDSSNYNEWEWAVADLTVSRWMALRAATSQPSGYAGNGWNPAAVTYIAFGVEFSDETDTLAGIKFDNVHLVGGRVTDSTIDATLTSSINTPNINVHRMGGTPTDVSAGNYSAGTQRVVLATNQPEIPAITRVKSLVDGTVSISNRPDINRVHNIVDGTMSISSINSTVAVYFDPASPSVSATFGGTMAVYFDQSNPKVNLGTDVVNVDATGQGDVPITLDGENVGISDGTLDYVTRVRNIVDGTLTTVANVTNITNTVGVNIGITEGTITVRTDPSYELGSIKGINSTVAIYFDQSEPTVKAEQSGTYAIYFDQSNPKVNLGTDIVNTTGTILISNSATGTYTGTSDLGKTLASPIANSNIKVFAYSVQTTGVVSTVAKFTNGSSTDLWTALATPAASASEIRGANMAVEPPGYIFATGANVTLALHTGNATLVHYSVSYFRESV